MRGVLIFCGCAIVVLLMSPGFWTLMNMQYGAQPIAIINSDGVAQETVSGPGSPWPDWAQRPDGGKVTVVTYYAPAPGHPATGFANVAVSVAAAAGQSAFAKQLADAGWTVALARTDAYEPSIPPKPFRMCLVSATSGARTLLYSLQDDPEGSVGRLYWQEGGAPKPLIGSVEGPC